jgi:CBS domain containing-hemolysin-like protein
MAEIIFILLCMHFLSFIASLLDGVLVGATVAEVEILRTRSPLFGRIFAKHQSHIDRTLSAVLAIDSLSTTIGSVLLGPLIVHHIGPGALVPCSIAIGIAGFVFTDILPKTLGIYCRHKLLYWMVIPLELIVWAMYPLAYLCAKLVNIFLPPARPNHALTDEAFILTAKCGVRDGVLSSIEGEMVEHTLTLDDVDVGTIAQRQIFSVDGRQTVAEFFRKYPEIPYSRIPVHTGNIHELSGIVRRRDLLKALANDEHGRTILSLARKTVSIPADVKISSALETLLHHFQQIGIIVDGSEQPIGVLTIEDIFEYILGRDIFEYDDVSNHSRSDARRLRLLGKRHILPPPG